MPINSSFTAPRPEYPRPHFVRDRWASLNGEWQFAFDDDNRGLEDSWFLGANRLPLTINVPYAYQYPLSGIDDKSIHEIVWYARSFTVPEEWAGDDLLLHFGAVDYSSTIWVNGEQVGANQGGHVPFTFDIAPYVCTGKANRIVLRVEDRQDETQPRGKQSATGISESVDYYCTTGIWQSVWLEPAPQMRIHDFQITPRLNVRDDADALDIQIFLHAHAGPWRLQVELLDGDQLVIREDRQILNAGETVSLLIPNAKRWSPRSPHLYDIVIRLMRGEEVIDKVQTYAGIRAISVCPDGLYINGERTYLRLVLDQGYWPDGGMTAPSDAALKADVEWAMRFGFNGARKHQKVEDPRWLYWCDRLGFLVWGEMANAREWSMKAEEMFIREWERVVRRDYNHPSIVVWVPINESWGVPGLSLERAVEHAFVERVVAMTRRLDLSRPVIDNDGWEHTDVTDILTIHDYTSDPDKLLARYANHMSGGSLPDLTWNSGNGHSTPTFYPSAKHHGQPIMITEMGGLLMIPEVKEGEKLDGLYEVYSAFTDPNDLLAKYAEIFNALAKLKFVSGWCYTQLTDIEQEMNGLLTYDRKPKIEPEKIAEINHSLFPDS